MVQIPLVGGGVALVDDADVQLVAPYKWYCVHGYAHTTFHRKGASRTDKDRNVNLSMHRLITGAKSGELVDHKNRFRLDNRRDNLRIADPKKNSWNCGHTSSKSGFVGVVQESENVFVARLGTACVGYYRTAEDAAKARDLAAIAERGEFAVLNFPKEQLPSEVPALPPRNVGVRTSSVRGVSFAKNRKARQKWRVVLKKKHLGWFDTEEDAIEFVRGIPV